MDNHNTAIALGNFDGVHIAHKKIIENAVVCAEKSGLKSLAYMFETHPQFVLGDKNFKTITDNTRKSEIIKGLGADTIYYEKTTADILSMTPENFARDILSCRFGAKYVSVGYNYRFGKGGEGDAKALEKLGRKYGFEVIITDRITKDGQDISSSLLRKYIANGEVDAANNLMCKPYAVCGVVSGGKHLGTSWGIATANVEIPDMLLTPKRGVYLTKTLIDGKQYKSVTNIGTNPTVEHAKPRSETHIIDFNGDLYGKYIEITFCEMIRPEIKFDSVDGLICQIRKDIEYVKKTI
ncbi:MAG: bifunctional riboflavin kinase/FAD synthetase [Clostridia bacterium]|nr:bifunctional riboflavin kinase/FAD synthetase [Clostridia bacterium]